MDNRVIRFLFIDHSPACYKYGVLSGFQLRQIEALIPLGKLPQSVSERGAGFETHILFQSLRVCKGDRHITGLHGNQLLVSIKVIIRRQNTGPHKLLRKDLHEVQQIFGIGVADVINGINASGCRVMAVDMPSGLLGENNYLLSGVVVSATDTLTLQFPKLSLLVPENDSFVGRVHILDIGLSPIAMERSSSTLFYTDEMDVKPFLKPRAKYSHKGHYGRALLVAGSRGMAGASVLAARAALRSGVGLLTVHLPSCNNVIMQVAVPEAMTSVDSSAVCFSDCIDVSAYSAVAVGPGLGRSPESEKALLSLIDNCREAGVPMVLDADALNILSGNSEYLHRLPQGSVLTPHPGEFARLFGKITNTLSAINSVRAFVRDYNVTIVLKGAHTVVIAPDSNLYFNSTGNPGMATGGSGDVLTGVVLALLAQGITAIDAARVAVYAHGLAGDIAAECKGHRALVAGDIIECLPSAWKELDK